MVEKNSSSLTIHGTSIRASASTSTNNEEDTITAVDIADHLPIELIKSEIVPPSPNPSNSTSDWLQDFLGLSWIAYAASSLLVISHFPSPLSEDQTLIGPIFRQAIELSNDESAVAMAVAWSPLSPSEGDVAAAIGNCICLCSESSGGALGTLCWGLNTVLKQSHVIEAIRWTGSGDGVVTTGVEIVLWRRKDKTWEIAWKCEVELPQTLVSATWSTKGPVATAIYPVESSSLCGGKSRCVLVWENGGKSGVVKSELRHPQPVSMIQWRPSNGMGSQRAVLLTCCLDGTMRLWCEIDGWRGKKIGKEPNEQKSLKRSFHVISVIEVNQSLNGSLGTDIFATWAVELGGLIDADETSKSDLPGKCEWLIGFSPGGSLTLWALHCLDDLSPLRFPRVTLWKKQQITGFQGATALECKVQSFVTKTVISRRQAFGPPTTCSLFQFLSDNSMRWLQYTPRCNSAKDGFLCIDGHTGRMLQIDVHPCSCEVGLAASLDSNGLVLLWSLSTVSSCNLGMPTFGVPTWKILGKLVNQDSLEYSSVRWAPLVFNDLKVLLLSHLEGIDCFIVNLSLSIEVKTQYHKLCTIPFSGHSRGIRPINIFALPLHSTCEKVSITNKFMLLAVWMGEFQAISWEVAFHFADLSQSRCACTFDVVQDNGERSYESNFAGCNVSVVVGPCSSELPSPYNCEKVTSVGVVPLANLMSSVQKRQVSSNEFCYNNAAYHMATGHFDGSLKLWKSTHSHSSNSHSQMVHIPWQLMGVFQTHQGPISMMSLSSCGRKIATISAGQQLEHACTLCIWEIVHVLGSGTLLLEGKLSSDVVITGLNWLTAGNGRLLLGVCAANEFRVYAHRRIISQTLVKSENLLNKYLWVCIAFSQTSLSVHDFCWGPGATPVLIHERYFSLLSKWSFCNNKKHQPKCCSKNTDEENPHGLVCTEKGLVCSVFTDSGTWDDKELSTVGERKDCMSLFSTKLNVKNWSSGSKQPHKSSTKIGCWSMLQLAEMLSGPLPVYHPVPLLLNIYSGNWRRAWAAVQHLVECLDSDPHVSCDKARTHNHIIPQIPLSMLFDEPSSTELGDKVLQWGQNVASGSSAEVSQKNSILSFGYNSEANLTTGIYHSTSIKSEISSFSETLEKYHDISGTTSMERTQILAIVDVLDEITGSRRHSVYESFDAPGRRFWVSVRFQQLHYRRRFGRLATMEELVVDSELMGWAHHSDCQESLCSSTLSDEPTWQEMRNLGVGFWFTDSMHLRKRMEKLARSQYLKNKDPKDCALLYIALNRLQVLAGLFKISRDEKDKPLAGFLSRNFQEEKNKAAALKNAYVLMGRHQHELASAFFLLGGDPSSAIIVCAKNLGDEQLALVICRLVEGCGGPLEGHLISKFLLPSALERGDHWLASLLEWLIGNYSKSFLRLLGIKLDPLIEQVVSWNVASFSDPKVGQYGVMLAAKTCMKISIGEAKASMLTRWATAVTSIALNRCGLPLEALECVPCSVGTFEGKDSILDDGTDGFLHEILRANNSNWLSGDVALYLESNLKLSLASQYISNLIKEHPNWPYLMLTSSWVFDTENRACHCRPSVENFNLKLKAVLTTFERKYSLSPALLMNMILVFSYNNGLLFHGYHVLHGCISQERSHYTSTTLSSVLHPPLPQLFLNAVEECEHFVARYIVACSIIPGSYRSSQLHALNLYTEGLICALESLRDVLKIYCPGILSEDLSMKASMVIELTEYYVFLVSMWIQRNIRGLTLMISPMLSKREGEHSPEVDLKNLKSACRKTRSMIHRSLGGLVVGFPITNCSRLPNEECSNLDDERWQPIGACIWKNLAHFNREHLKPVPDIVEVNCRAKVPPRLSSLTFNYEAFASDAISVRLRSFDQMPETLSKMLISTFECISTSLATQMQSFLSLKLERGLSENLLVWLEESMKSQSTALYDHLNQETDDVEIIVDRNRSSLLEILWQISIHSKEIREWFLKEQMNTLRSISENSFKGWRDLYKCISTESKNGERTSIGQDAGVATTFSKGDTVVPIVRKHSENSSSPCSSQKNLTEVAYFQNPEVIYKRNGELIEVMCINSVDHRQAAVASNRKGLAYFTCKDEEPSDYHSEFVWAEADWPRDGWACSESTPIPTPVSPGIGLGGKGVHLGLGGATIGVKSLARPGRDLTGGGAFGIPGYAGIGASGLGWGIQEDFEEFVDPPATVDNVHSRALSSHPSRPFFLVGSSNTHVYLWEFCNEKATATYGMLPAANVPPPYALASISALQFGPCGHRFATGALDGTVCTWQLEVGGRSNIPPTESSLCFNSHASDISYVAASGSVIAAAGHSSNDVNVVIWDTLAPPTTSQASLTCHQGGARSISVFDNDIGSGSISPLIVTGGTGGDVALHDFRFIATGKTKQHRHPNMGDVNIKYSAIDGVQSGNSHKVGEIPKGMLWYIPKAHLGSVTRIATIPNTSLFLTGSKDGDVKLWDAARAKLVFHWPKLHERHTFLQPSSRGFGGIVRAAVTDIQVLRNGFLTCGGDGTVKMIKFNMTKS